MNNLQMVRGDTAAFKFQRLDNNGNVITTQADKVYFTVKRTPDIAKVFLQKTINDMIFDVDGTYHIIINPEDTDNAIFKREYFYDIEVIQSGIKTTIAFGKIVFLPEVTWTENEV